MLRSLVTIFLLTSTVFGQELTGDQIVTKVNELLTPKTSISTSRMTIVTTSGANRTFLFKSWSKNEGEKNLVRYLKPSRVKDQAVLMLNNADDIWMFFPRTQRVRKLATHAKKQKMQGSDFSYEDMGSGDTFIDDFDKKRLTDDKMQDHDCYKVELIRKQGADVSYSRIVMWVIKENFYPIVIDYYNEDNPDLWEKRLLQSDIQTIDGLPTAMKAVMHNKRDNTQTEMELLTVKYNQPLDDNMFSERNLKK